MKKFRLLALLFVAMISTVFISCEKDDDDDDDEKTTELLNIVSKDTKSGKYTVKLYSKDTLFEGYNKVAVAIVDKNTGKKVKNAEIVFAPLMHMIKMTHNCPFENPANTVNSEDMFEGALVFLMPSNSEENWSLGMNIKISGEEEVLENMVIPTVKSFNVAGDDKLKRTKKNYVAFEDKKYFVSIVTPTAPKVGLNDIEITVHTKVSMMSFPPVENITIKMTPEMPSMNHGSPSNVNPISIGNGHYKGKVNLTMTGWWRLNFVITDGGNEIETYLDIEF